MSEIDAPGRTVQSRPAAPSTGLLDQAETGVIDQSSLGAGLIAHAQPGAPGSRLGFWALGLTQGVRAPLALSRMALAVQRTAGNQALQRLIAQRAPPTPAALPKADVRFQSSGNVWIVTLDNIPVAEISVDSQQTSLRIDMDITESLATITVYHSGDARIAASNSMNASPKVPVRLTDVDVRQQASGQQAPSAPGLAVASPEGEAKLVLARPEAADWLFAPAGELGINVEPSPGSMSEFEQAVRKGEKRITAVVLDPDDQSLVIGYRVFATTGMTRILDREGEVAYENEIGLETPLLDPIDLIPTPGTMVKAGAGVAGKISVKLGAKALGKTAAKEGVTVSMAVLARMRGVSRALLSRGVRKAITEVPVIVTHITEAGVAHSFDRHAAQWFGRVVARETHYKAWRALIERAATSDKAFSWSVGAAKTVARLARIEGKYFVVQFFEETGELATAFVPSSSQLSAMLKLVK